MFGKRFASLPRFTPRPSRRVSTIGVVAALAAGVLSLEAVGTASADTLDTVTLTVNGVGTKVTTAAPTVRELLTERSVTVDDTDLLSPAPWTSITDGMTVEVDHAAVITVDDGTDIAEHLVTADIVVEAHEELDLPSPTFAALNATSYEPFSYQRTVMFGPGGNRLTGTAIVRDGSHSVVQDVRIGFPVTRHEVDHRVVRRDSNLLHEGSKRVYQEGRDGLRKDTWRRQFVDGTLTRERVVRRVWVVEPRRKVVLIGTGPNWPALAQCESGGNPNAVNPAGFYGLYQFSLSTWRGLGGTGYPTDHGYWEQTRLAWKLYQRSGASPWPHCGVYL